MTDLDSNTAKVEQYALAVGKVIVNFHALETSLRLFLQSKEIALNPNKVWVKIKPEPVGQTVPLDSFSSYESLNNLVKRFNALIIAQSHPEFAVDLSIIELRDALAHGRVFSLEPGGFPLHLLKFSRPVQGSARVTVTNADVMDVAWLEAQTKRVAIETAKVAAAAGATLYPANGNQRA